MKKAHEDAAIKRLVEQFGAEVLVSLETLPTMKRSQRARARHAAIDAAFDCTACGLCEHVARKDDRGPVYPKESFMTPSDLIVLTLHPRTGDDRYHRVIRHALSNLDYVDPDRVSFVPVVSCVPRDDEGALRTPTQQHRTACEANLYRALEAANTPYVLAIGQPALKAWRDLRLEQVKGIIGTWRNRWTITAVEHPAAPLREGKAAMRQWYGDVARAVDVLYGDLSVGIGTTCTQSGCNDESFAWDGDAMPWCRRHFKIKTTKRPRDFVDEALPMDEQENT